MCSHESNARLEWTFVCVRVYLDNVSEARVFTLFVLDELQSLRLLAAQLGRLFLELVSSCTFKLGKTHTTSNIMCT